MSWDWEKLKQKHKGTLKEENEVEEKKLKDWFNNPWIIYPAYFLIWIILVVSIWFPVRWFHYKFAYEKKIEAQIIEMVKPEYLKEKYRKDL